MLVGQFPSDLRPFAPNTTVENSGFVEEQRQIRAEEKRGMRAARLRRRLAGGLWRQALPLRTTRRRTVVIGAFYALYLVPIGVGVAIDPSRVYWLVSGLALAAVVLRLWEAGGFARVAALAVNAVSTVVNVLMMISLVLQGQGFNAQFFYHMNLETVVAAWAVFWPWCISGGCYLLMVGLWPGLLRGPDDAPGAPARTPLVAALMALAIILNASVLSFVWHVTQGLIRSNGIVLVAKPGRTVAPSGTERPSRWKRPTVGRISSAKTSRRS